MKIRTSLMAGALLIGSLGAINSARAADDQFIEQVPLAASSYCHDKFAAINELTLNSANPTQKSPTTGDVIDYYGPCSETPTGQDQQWQQKLQAENPHDNQGFSQEDFEN
jgi:hypothetical protein